MIVVVEIKPDTCTDFGIVGKEKILESKPRYYIVSEIRTQKDKCL